jgi:D-ribose pyranase
MIKNGILNPAILSLVARVRHTNLLIIADRGFPYWNMIETVDISLVDGIPTVLQVFEAIKPNFDIERIYMAEEFLKENPQEALDRIKKIAEGAPIEFEPHDVFKKLAPSAIGLIRTGDTMQYANMILLSGRSEGAIK